MDGVTNLVTVAVLEAHLGLRTDVAARVALSVGAAEAEVRLLAGVTVLSGLAGVDDGDPWKEAVRAAVCALALGHALPMLALVYDTTGGGAGGVGGLGGLLAGSYEVSGLSTAVTKRYLSAGDVRAFAGLLRERASALLGRTGVTLSAVMDEASAASLGRLDGYGGGLAWTPGVGPEDGLGLVAL